MLDWGAGDYEATAVELAPVAEAVVERARIHADEDVLDVACGTGNAAAGSGARRAANEDPDGFLVHTPYVVHELHHG